MPYVFVDDGYPEASEYDSNYVWYDSSDPRSLSRALAEAKTLTAERISHERTAMASRGNC